MWRGFYQLWSKTWGNLLSALSTSTLSVILFSFILPIVGFIVALILDVWHRKPAASVWSTIHASAFSVQTLLGVSLTGGAWILLLVWFFITTSVKNQLELNATQEENNRLAAELEETKNAAATEIAGLQEKVPPEMAIEILEVKRYPIPYDGTDSWARRGRFKFHVFASASIKLNKPRSVKVSGYNLKLVRRNGTVSTKRYDEISEVWEFWDSEDVLDEGHHGHIPTLKNDLTWDSLEQGWLHFVTEERTSLEEIQESLVHLIVVTASGSPSAYSSHSISYLFRQRPVISPKHDRPATAKVDATEETDEMWLGVDEIWRFKENFVTRSQVAEFYPDPQDEKADSAQPIYIWLRCKICKLFHRGQRVSAMGYPISALKTRDIECPSNRGKYKFYGQQDWIQGKDSN